MGVWPGTVADLGLSATLDPGFWRGRSVFLTGHTGFKGAWLALLLERLGARVTGYALPPPTDPSLFALAGVEGALAHQVGDIRDAATLRAAMAKAAPSIVFHLAAQSLVKRARREPVETFTTNVIGTIEVLEAVRATPSVEAAVIVTSDKVYANRDWAWAYREDDRLGGQEPYNASKACCELVVETWRHSYLEAVPIATARAGNVIGGGDWAEDRLVPDAIRAFIAGDPLVVRAPESVRPWQHVLEPLTGYCLMAEALAQRRWTGSTLNFGPAGDDAVSVRTVADRLVELWGGDAAWAQDTAAHPYEARLLEVDSSLARKDLGWVPKWRLEEGLRATAAWYREYANGGEMSRFSRDQVEAHLAA